MRVLITGGAGFVGSNLARSFVENGDEVIIMDNLSRRGSEMNLPHFKKLGIHFIHGDVRIPLDFELVSLDYELIIHGAAEPSVDASSDCFATNVQGTINAINFARKYRAEKFIYLSSSRVYSLASLNQIKYKENDTRFIMTEMDGISEDFPTNTERTFYGATKLASEMFLQEYAGYSISPDIFINRCGVMAGPWQFGKINQGVFALWMMRHYFAKDLKYTGFGGAGKQVRDLLHPKDLFDLIQIQIADEDPDRAGVYNVGGGLEVSTSMLELTKICQEITGNTVKINSNPHTRTSDIPIYISDLTKVKEWYGWHPKRTVEDIMKDIHTWIQNNVGEVRMLL